jgi:PAS domain S-box-containing protein
MSSNMTRSENKLEAAPDALVGMDQAGVIRFVNHQTESLFGCERDDLIGEPIQMLVPEDLWEVFSEHRDDYFADPLSRSMGLDLELIGRRGDGTGFPVNISLSVIETGDVLLVITSADEVTKRKRALENSQRMTAIAENSNDAIIGKTLKGIVTSWNPAAEKMYGYSSEEIIGKFIHMLNPADRPGEVMSILAKIKAGGSVENFETMRVRKDGTRFPVSLSVAPIHAEDGAVVGASVIGRDMTDQKEAFDLAQRMACMVEFSGEAIVGGTIEGIITSWNPAAERMFGYCGEEIIGKSGRLVLSEDRTNGVLPILASIRAGQCVGHLETMCIRRDGTVFPVSVSVAPIRDSHGAIVGLSAIARDVTEQK